jgi:hypothetical protein
MCGVIEETLPDEAKPVRVTNIERTLIDIVVRPIYAGGVPAILDAYSRASGLLSLDRLVTTLDTLDYLYPYHQSIGFCLEHSGCYNAESLELFRSIPKMYDFYLDYQMENPGYSNEWRLYYPQNL